tara:strand:+ start:118 stop:594 length:477 start_codon:yes stop_codon:yes gene_type:complete
MKFILKQFTLLHLLFFTIFFANYSYSQQTPKGEDKEAAKIAFFTNKLALTSEESKTFWPVVNEMEKELKDLRIQMKDQIKRPKGEAEISDKELESMMDARMEMGKKQMDIKIKYHEKFKEILPIRKVAKYYEATKEFKKLQAQRKARMKQRRTQQQNQ